MDSPEDVALPMKAPFDWSMAVLIGLCAAYFGCVAWLVATGAAILG